MGGQESKTFSKDKGRKKIFKHNHDELSALLEPVNDFADLHALLPRSPEQMEAASNALFQLPCLGAVDRRQVFAAIKRWALAFLEGKSGDCEDTSVVPSVVEAAGDAVVTRFTAGGCRAILANAFLGNVLDCMEDRKVNAGGLSFERHYTDRVGIHKTAALVLYFHAGMALEGTDDDARIIEFQHIRVPSTETFQRLLEECSGVILDDEHAVVHLHSDSMEAPQADAFVNFANPNFGYGKFIASCTQEEILQVCSPEFNVGMLFIGYMDEDEVVNVTNCRRYSTYKGYLHSFECTGPADGPVQDILTLDACTHQHFTKGAVLRDLMKAYASFAALKAGHTGAGRPVVSTGRWGCGVFGGTPTHKFVQQVVAARLAGVDLEFSTFGTPDGCDTVLAALQASPCTVGRAWVLLQRESTGRAFERDFLTWLQDDRSTRAEERPNGEDDSKTPSGDETTPV